MEVNEQGSDPNSETLAQLNKMHSGESAPSENESAEIETPPETAQAAENIEASGEQETPQEVFEVEGQTFASEREAFDWLKNKYSQSETEKLILEAKTEGMQTALGQMHQQSAPAQEIPEEAPIDENAFYENPAKYMAEREAKIRESLKNEIMSESQQVSAERQAWDDFFKAHPDLDGFQEDCQMVLNQNLQMIQTLASKDRKKAQDYLATKTREKFQNYIEKMKPTKTLSNAKSGPSAGNVTQSVTPKKAESSNSDLDFATQLRNMKNRHR